MARNHVIHIAFNFINACKIALTVFSSFKLFNFLSVTHGYFCRTTGTCNIEGNTLVSTYHKQVRYTAMIFEGMFDC